jgi:osmotically-inducible protein OsmY
VGGQLRDFRVLVRAEGLVLQGCAQTYHAKQQAEDAVRATTGVPILANEIEVS